MIYNKLAEQESIQISREDTDKVIKRFAENYNLSEQQAAEALHKSGKVASIRDTLLEDKVLDLLIGRAKVVEKKPEESSS
jgi:trigger factor